MSQKPNLKLVVNNRFPVQCEAENEFGTEGEEIKISWWSTLTWHSKTQFFVFAILFGSFGSAIFFHKQGNWHVATAMWMLSFFLMFLIWTLEYRLRIDSEPFNKSL